MKNQVLNTAIFWAGVVLPLARGGVLEDLGLSPKTDVSNELKLAYDIDAMRAARRDFDAKLSIYTSGSDQNDGSLTLQSLSKTAETKYGKYPLYNIYKAGFEMLGVWLEGDKEGKFDGKPVSEYADTVVNDLFRLNISDIEAEAALACNVAMAYYGNLYDMLDGCKSNNMDAMNAGLDKASALWVGAGQVRGDHNSGNLFYAVADYVSGSMFNQFDTNDASQAQVNTNVITLFQELREDIDDDNCASGSEEGYVEMRTKVQKLVHYLNQVLVQMLLHKVMTFKPEEPTDFVELYSLALIPQVASCDDDLFHELVQLTITSNVEADTKQDVISAIQSSYSCLGLTCEQIGAYQRNVIEQCDFSGDTTMAGYTPTVDVRDVGRIDRDIRQINWLMQYNAVEAAKEYYIYGWNTDFTLQQLARADTTPVVSDTYASAAVLFGGDGQDRGFADNMILDAFDGKGAFDPTNIEQRQAYVDSLLRGFVLFLSITNELESAVNLIATSSDNKAEAQSAWDSGIALFLGATEGEDVGDEKARPGESLYGLAKDVCIDFHLCDSSDDIPPINEDLLFLLVQGSELLDDDPTSLGDTYDELLDKLIVPVIQGMLRSVIEASVTPDGPDVGYKYGFSRAVLAFFDDENSAEVDAMKPILDVAEMSAANVDVIFNEMEKIMESSAVDCQDINAIRGSDNIPRDVCKGVEIDAPGTGPKTAAPNYAPPPTPPPVQVLRPAASPKAAPPTDNTLAWGSFAFSDQSVADNDARVALDVKQMWLSENVDDAKVTYNQGVNFTSGLHGLDAVTSLSAMSTTAKDTMAKDAIYNFYRYAFYEDEDFDGDGDVWAFANTVILMALSPESGNSAMLAAEATVVINSFFIILRQLNEAARQCKSGSQPEALNFLDSAVAIWIGDEQEQGKYNSGYMMYSIAQMAREHFGMEEGEAQTNVALMQEFNAAKDILQQCSSESEASYKKMRVEIKEIARLLTIPMVQELLYYLSVDDQNFSEMFAVAYLPQIASCSAGDFDAIEYDMFNFLFNSKSEEEQTTTLEAVASGLVCIGITCADLGDASKSEYAKLKNMVADICEGLDVLYSTNFLGGYKTEDGSSIAQLSRLDLDVHQIGIFMRTETVETALEFFEYGYNSQGDDGDLRSLQSFSDEVTNKSAGALAVQFKNYYNETNHPGSLLTDIFNGGAYGSAPRAQKAALVKRLLQASIVYLGVHSYIERSLDACNNLEQGEKYVDSAAALFMGSLEGPRSGGSTTNSGVMLMALGKEVCDAFDSCESTGDSSANELVLFAFADMKQWLTSFDCEPAATIKDETLFPMLSVPIIQATLKFAEESEDLEASSEDESFSSLDAVAQGILPQIFSINETSADTIADNSKFVVGEDSVADGVGEMVDAFTYVIRGLGVKCSSIGTLVDSELSTCNENIAPPPDTSTTLGGDTTIYKSTTYVDNFANIALDIKQMEDELKVKGKTMAQEIYKEGENSPIYDKFGVEVNLMSLSALSTNATVSMKRNPFFQTAVYALKDDSGNYLGKPATQFADTIVQEFFQRDDPSTLPAEAAVSLNLWMEIVNRLYESVENCKNQRIVGDDGIHAMDIVAAYWIGDGEAAGDGEQGHLLYNLAEVLSPKFGTIDESGLAAINVNFLRLLNQARLEVSISDSCTTDLTTARKLNRAVNRIVGQMIAVQIQGLIDAIVTEDSDRVRIFAHGLVPLVKPCNAHTFEYLFQKLIEKSYEQHEKNDIIESIYRVLHCFEITCDDVGEHSESSVECSDPPSAPSLAGYKPSNNVADYAALDLDISLIDVLMAQEAYEAAADVYIFGKHSSPLGSASTSIAPSLKDLARSTRRSSVPDFNQFVQYYGSDNFYADTVVNSGLNAADDVPAYRRRVSVVLGAQYLVMYMAVMEQFHESVRECKSERPDAASLLWNRGAAYIIGSMEGQVNNPYERSGGLFFWGISKKNCADWGTCHNIITGSTEANERIQRLLYTGRGAVSAESCTALEKATNEMEPLVQSILIQATLEDIVTMHEERDEEKKNLHHARAYVGAQALLPLINEQNRDAATVIGRNLDYEGSVLEDGFANVVRSFTDTLKDLHIACELIGGTRSVNFCSGEVESESKDKNGGMIAGIILGILFGGLIAVFLLWFRNRKKSDKESDGGLEQPKLFPNTKGVIDEADKDYDPESSAVERPGSWLNKKDDDDDDDDKKESGGNSSDGDDFMEIKIPEPV